MTSELLPCPFCGETGVMEDDYHLPGSAIWGCAISCDNFCVQVFGHTEDEAIAAWNTRPDGWLPISSAPKDGSLVDLWDGIDRYPDCKWGTHGDDPDLPGEWLEETGGAIHIDGFTHWRRAPAPPLARDTGGALEVGKFYWVLIVFDPDTDEKWQNNPMPARLTRFNSNGEPHFLTIGSEDDEWPVRWVGKEVE